MCFPLAMCCLAATPIGKGESELREPLIITQNTVLQKGATLTRPIVIQASNITLDGNGAIVQGPGEAGDAGSFAGTGITAKDCSGVALRNVRVRGFAVALSVVNGTRWCIEDCDFSGNYTNPDAGWGDEGRRGGIVMTGVDQSVIRRNKAKRVWNGLDLRQCNDNKVENNDFSHCSNVALKMWNSCRNQVQDNDFSYGIRIDPGEKHARDSAGVLVLSGSNDNRFERNDIRYGGDGVFVRALNNWVSTGNVFIENDASYAHNNCIECVCPGNTFLRNKANHGSYGFWLSGADGSVVIGNEAAYNGCPDGNNNAPEKDFGHGGIVFVSGSSYHSLVSDNYCHHNNGGGIVLRGDLKTDGQAWKAHHWIIQQNRLEHNRWGIFARFADRLHVAGNTGEGNAEPDFMEDVSHLTLGKGPAGKSQPPKARLSIENRMIRVGQTAILDASLSKGSRGKPLTFLWDLGGQDAEGKRVERVFTEPGFYRISLTVHDGTLADLAYEDLYVLSNLPETGTEGTAEEWQFRAESGGRVAFSNDAEALCGKTSLAARVDPADGGEIEIVYPCANPEGWDLKGKTRLAFWIRSRSEGQFRRKGNPVLRLYGKKGAAVLVPAKNPLVYNPARSEGRWTWQRVTVDLAGGGGWTRQTEGDAPPDCVHRIGFTFLCSGHSIAPYTVWLDGLTLE